jgi:very-short-patch-repair endonuclease
MKIKISKEQYLIKVREKHGEQYDYSLLNETDVNSNKKVQIICKHHGIFLQHPKKHFINGCPKCARKRIEKASLIAFDSNYFEKVSNKIHNFKYDYSKVKDLDTGGYSIKVEIICKAHGVFFQKASKHMTGQGCPWCSMRGPSVATTKEFFIAKATELHDNLYDYSKVEFVKNLRQKVTIICPKHGDFIQSIKAHLSPCGCPKCKYSKGELKVFKTLNKVYNGEIEVQKRFKDLFDKNVKNKLSFDFFLPAKNLLIEYDGEYHFKKAFFNKKDTEETSYFRLKEVQRRDKLKSDYAIKNGYNLLRISYLEYNNIENILLENLI